MTPTWSFACPDWVDRLRTGRSLLPDLPLNRERADRAVRIFDKLRVPDIAGQPSFGEATGEWFRDIVRAAFGSLDDNGVRHVSEIFALVGKKNGKTTNGGGLIVTALLVNEVPRGEMLFIGPTQEIADLAFQQAAGIIEADEEGYLQKRFHVIEHLKMIRDRRNKAFVKIKTFDMRVMTGSKPIIVLIDELHIMGSIHFAARVLGQIRGALQAKKNSFMLIISTQSDEPPAGVFRTELDYARAVRDGKIAQSRMLPMLWEFPAEMQMDESKPWADPKNWPMVMPSLGRIFQLDAMQAGYHEAREKGAIEERRWASQHLNVEIGVALGGWKGTAYWAGAGDESITLAAILARCDVAVVSIDGGGLDDLLGLAVIGRDKASRDWMCWVKAWAQPDVLDRRKRIAPRLLDFARRGDLVICDHPTQDFEDVAEICATLHGAGLLPEKAGIGLDPAGVTQIIDVLAARGMAGDLVVAVPQGWRLSGAVKGLARKLKDGTFWHAVSPMMAWIVGNAKPEQRGNAVVIEKAAAGEAKIDPLIAVLGAVQLMSRNPERSGGPSVYETRGVLMV